MTLLTELQSVLKKDKRLVKGSELLTNTVIELALKMDKDLIKLLLSEKKIKKHFFVEAEGALVFDKEKFIEFISTEKFLPDSYTKFKQNIGLSTDDEYLAKSGEVVLSWPYKDCILEGGQEKEDEKRKEIFYNETLAPDEIDRLLDPKVLTNFKRIDAKGERKVTEITPTDNLIIRGNNLLVLHSLLKKFPRRIKVIYIDPPYNRDVDSFYNDNFKRSSWLTFMKNRLEIAQKLLSEGGLIFVQIDDNQQGYLKVLMDEIFGETNFVNSIIVKPANPVGLKMKNVDKRIIRTKEFLLVYAKNYDKIKLNPGYIPDTDFSHYNLYLEKNGSKNPKDWVVKKVKEVISSTRKINPKNINNEMIKQFTLENIDKIYCSSFIEKRLDRKEFAAKNPKMVTIYKNPDGSEMLMFKKRTLFPLLKRSRVINGKATPMEILCDLWIDIKWDGISNEGGVYLPNGKKPERLLQRVLELTTEKGDIVLDFFLGCGTTCAVAHKMGMQYIGVEQLYYGENNPVARLKNVVKGDKTGISKKVGWKGGGDFVYCELKVLNELFVQKLLEAKRKSEILKIWGEMKRNGFLSHRVDERLFDENIEEFKKLPMDKQERLLIECLDKNHLYVNYSEIEDKQYKVSKEDIAVNRRFYEGT